MPLYIYSLVRRGVTPEINALSTALLLGSIGLVGLSLTAQSGGAVYTRAMSIGAGLGIGMYGLINLAGLFAPGAFSITSLILQLVLISAFLWVWRARGKFRDELAETNPSGRMLAWIAVFVTFAAAYLSVFLLFV